MSDTSSATALDAAFFPIPDMFAVRDSQATLRTHMLLSGVERLGIRSGRITANWMKTNACWALAAYAEGLLSERRITPEVAVNCHVTPPRPNAKPAKALREAAVRNLQRSAYAMLWTLAVCNDHMLWDRYLIPTYTPGLALEASAT